MAVTKRGRKSAAALAIAPRPLEVVERQRPPHDLTDEEVTVWAAVVESEPADWFSPSTVPLLAQFCRHVVQSRRVAELIERATGSREFALDEWEQLLRIQDRESRAIAMLATKMRISQQATTNHRGNKKPSPIARTWEFTGKPR